MFKSSEINFLSKDYCQQFSKPLVYLHYVANSEKFKGASKEYVLRQVPFTDKTTDESIINEFKEYEKSQINVSQKAKLLPFIKSVQNEYNVINDIETFPNYSVVIEDLSNSSDTTPDLGLVWEINRISPPLTGMLFENIIAECLKIKEKIYDISTVICDSTSNIENKTIEGILERNFIKRELIRRGNGVRINNKHFIYVGDQKLKKDHFISRIHYFVFLSLLHFFKRNVKGEDVEAALNILDYLKMNQEVFDDYIFDMENSTLIKNLSKDTNIKHGEVMRISDLSGECDFISDQSIIDIKVYREPCPDMWFSQLYLYQKLFGDHKNLIIINLYENKVYKFNYDRTKQ